MGEESAILGRLLADSTVLNKGTEDDNYVDVNYVDVNYVDVN